MGYLPPEEIAGLMADFPDDVDRLERVSREAGLDLTRERVTDAYAAFSEEEYCAGWLLLPVAGQPGDEWLLKYLRMGLAVLEKDEAAPDQPTSKS